MQTETPGVENGAEALEAVEETTVEPPPLITGPVPVLWFGAGSFLAIFLLLILMLIRGRVIKPARRKTMQGPVFEPAGENAEITFDDLGETDVPEEPQLETPVASSPQPHIDEDDEKEEAPLTLGPELAAQTPEGEDDTDEKPKRSAFAGLFSRKQPEDHAESDEHFDDMGALEESEPSETTVQSVEEEIQPEPEEAEISIEPQEEATPGHSIQQELERDLQRERGVRAFENIQAEEDAAFERRQSEAAIEKGLQSFGAADQSAHAEAKTFDVTGIEDQVRLLGVSLERRINALVDRVDAKMENAATTLQDDERAGTISEAHFAEFAELLSEQFGSLRESTNSAIDNLSSRITKLETAPTGAAALSSQVADLNRILGGALSPASEARAGLSDVLNRVLPAGSFALSHKLTNGKVAAALVSVPGSPTPFVVDDQFPLDAFATYKRQRLAGGSTAENNFRGVMRRHIADSVEDFVIRGETGDHAFLLAPTEQIFTALHTDFADLMKESHDAGVWIMSPTTLAATLQALFSATTAGAAPGNAVGGELLDEIIALRKRVSTLETEKHSAATALKEDAPRHSNGSTKTDGLQGDLEREAPAEQEGIAEVSINRPTAFSRADEEEAFENLENDEGFAEKADDPTAKSDRPPFPLR